MDTEDVPIEQAAASALELLSRNETSIATFADVMDVTTVLETFSEDPSAEEAWLSDWVDALQADIESAIRARGDGKRARLLHEVELCQLRLQERVQLLRDLEVHRRDAGTLQKEIDDVEISEAKRRRDLINRRIAAAKQRVAEQIQKLEEERVKAQEQLERAALGDYVERKKQWEDSASDRERRAGALRQDAEYARKLAEATQTRAATFNKNLITRTVAGYLVWIGYASVPATGAVFAQLIAGENFSLDWIIETARSFADTPWVWFQRFWPLMLLFLIGLALLLVTTYAVDKLIYRLDPRWRWRQRERANPIGQPAITRRSFVRLFALVPYALIGCMAVAFVAAGQVKDDIFRSFISSAADTAIGSTIAMMATAVMMMYIIKVIEPRESGPTFRRSWEMVLAPGAIVFAVALAAVIANDKRWSAWMLFMLLGSLSLAYGLIYHGIYKDAEKAQEELDTINAQIFSEQFGPERPKFTGAFLQQSTELAVRYARDRQHLENIAARLSLGFIPLYAPPPPKLKVVRYWLTPAHWFTSVRTNGHEPPQKQFEIMDSEIAPEILEELDRFTRQKAHLEIAKRAADKKVEELEQATSRERHEQIRNDLSDMLGRIDEFNAEDEEWIARADKGANELWLRIRGQAASSAPLRQSVRSWNGQRTPNSRPGTRPPALPPDSGEDRK
ncbi:MAG: hypothetical protein DMF56_11680 [Acidobacteria bacterium]|nr:MAG: hypothetical protein DMF56_11680 [Acidobacteriota bacterium]